MIITNKTINRKKDKRSCYSDSLEIALYKSESLSSESDELSRFTLNKENETQKSELTNKTPLFLIDLCNLPKDVLKIIIQHITLIEKHVLRFVCKKLHNVVHSISYISSSLFHHPKKGFDAVAAGYDNIGIFKWITSIFERSNSIAICYNIARYSSNNVDLIKYAKSLSYPWDKSVCYGAVKNGNLEILKFARENGCEWDECVCSNAALRGYFEILKWARKNDCPWDDGRFATTSWLCHDHGGEATMTCGLCPHHTCSNAAFGGYFEILKWARENGCPWDEWTCSYAAKGGHFEILKWLRENGCEWDVNTCSCASQAGHLDILKWCRENGCEWNADTCSYAAYRGHFKILKWARKNGCEWDDLTCSNAVEGGHFEALRAALARNTKMGI
jgi:hypothetical protein